MDKVVTGINSAATSLQLLAGGVLLVCLVVAGITAMKDGADGKLKLKDNLIYIVLGAAIAFAASTIATTITGWFQ